MSVHGNEQSHVREPSSRSEETPTASGEESSAALGSRTPVSAGYPHRGRPS